MCEGLELSWDYILLMILIYMAYNIFYMEIPPSLPATTTYTFLNPMTRPQSRLFLAVKASCLPVLCGTALLLPGLCLSCQGQRRQTIRTQG